MQDEDFPLMAHQVEALKKLRGRKTTGLFMEQGSGKTLTAIAYGETDPCIRRMLVVCRKDNIPTWEDEIHFWTDSKTSSVEGSKAQRLKIVNDFILSGCKYLILNYDCIRSTEIHKALIKIGLRFDLVIFDESVEIKTSGTVRHTAWKKVIKGIPHRLILDGRPVTVGPEDLYGQYLLLDDGATFGTNKWKFMQRYFLQLDMGGYSNWVLKKNALPRINMRLDRTAYRVRTRDCIDLPPTYYNVEYPEMLVEQQRHYDAMKKEFRTTVAGKDVSTMWIITQIRKLHQIASGFLLDGDKAYEFESGKAKTLKRLLTVDLTHKPKIVIWGTYKHELDMIRRVCYDSGMSSEVYNGDLSDKRKREIKAAFRDGDLKVFIGISSMGIGLNELVVADTAIYHSNSFSLRHRLQSEARIERQGQKGERINIIDLISNKTIDKAIYHNLKNKEELSDEVLDFKNVLRIMECL